ncbi:MAG: EscU/YscU/HrcU family type III secretion system export apparatus switch protein [Rhodospirillaceae bacterium]
MSEEDKNTGNIRRVPETKDAVAVALADGGGPGRPPKVVAGGRGRVAEQILQIAFAQGIKVREDADLAQLLSAVDVEEDIPTEALTAVAEILIYLYRANGAEDMSEKTRQEIVREWMGDGPVGKGEARS